MRAYLTILLTLACATAALAIVCAPDTCTRVRCAMTTEEACLSRATAGQVYQYQPHGGFCGCCSNCVRVLAENEVCSAVHLLGVPATVKCADGLHCNAGTHTCVKNPTIA